MSRSNWKTFTQKLNTMEKKTQHRNFILTEKAVNKTFEVYNGISYGKLTITKDMVGHRLGEYASTRSRNNIRKK